MTTLIIARHAETTHNRDMIIYDVDDETQLTDLGEKQAELLAKKLVDEEIDIVYSSDLKRCKDTLKPFLEIKKDIKVIYTKELREIDMGVFNGKNYSDFDEWRNSRKEHRFDMKPEKGESIRDVIGRVRIFLNKLLEKEKGKKIFLMTHGLYKRAVLMVLFNREDKNYYDEMRELTHNTALTILNLKDDGRHEVKNFYSIEHLEDLKNE